MPFQLQLPGSNKAKLIGSVCFLWHAVYQGVHNTFCTSTNCFSLLPDPTSPQLNFPAPRSQPCESLFTLQGDETGGRMALKPVTTEYTRLPPSHFALQSVFLRWGHNLCGDLPLNPVPSDTGMYLPRRISHPLCSFFRPNVQEGVDDPIRGWDSKTDSLSPPSNLPLIRVALCSGYLMRHNPER